MSLLLGPNVSTFAICIDPYDANFRSQHQRIVKDRLACRKEVLSQVIRIPQRLGETPWRDRLPSRVAPIGTAAHCAERIFNRKST